MQNRFTFKDSMLFLLVGVVGLLAFLSMQAGDRLWREMQKLESKMSDIERSGDGGGSAGIDDMRRELAELKTAIASRPINVHVTGVAASGTAAPAPAVDPMGGDVAADTSADGDVRDSAWARPGVEIAWQETPRFTTNPESIPGYAAGGEFTEIFGAQLPRITPYLS
ncbi:MAG: hypothetical protein ACYTDE_04485, partial [Planctomycetota bacterium]